MSSTRKLVYLALVCSMGLQMDDGVGSQVSGVASDHSMCVSCVGVVRDQLQSSFVIWILLGGAPFPFYRPRESVEGNEMERERSCVSLSRRSRSPAIPVCLPWIQGFHLSRRCCFLRRVWALLALLLPPFSSGGSSSLCGSWCKKCAHRWYGQRTPSTMDRHVHRPIEACLPLLRTSAARAPPGLPHP